MDPKKIHDEDQRQKRVDVIVEGRGWEFVKHENRKNSLLLFFNDGDDKMIVIFYPDKYLKVCRNGKPQSDMLSDLFPYFNR